MTKEFACSFLVCLVLCLPINSLGKDTTDKSGSDDIQPLILNEAHQSHVHSMDQPDQAEIEKHVGVDEQLGKKIALDITFRDEHDQDFNLGGFIKKPTLILPVFFSCPQSCNIMLANLAQAINDIPLEPGKEYQLIALSFDAEDTPAVALQAKENYFRLIKKDFSREQWKFLTGDKNQVDAVLNSLGYRYQQTGSHAFIHPNVLITIAPDGKIIRYLYGLRFLPFDIGMALAEAEKGTPQMSVRRLLTYCFDYDSKSKTYVFKSFRITAISIILVLAVFLFFLLRKGKKQ
jgi:protein SCO1/2